MIISPFDDLRGKRLQEPEGEEVEGSFGCQEYGCYEIITTAKYLRPVKILTWICSEGHISKMEEFEID